MDDSFNVSAGEFVVRLPTSKQREKFHQRLAELGTVEMLPALPDHVLLRLQEAVEGEPRQAWKDVRKFLSKQSRNVAVSPVLIDANNSPRYCEGTLGVRFKTAPTKTELAEFSETFGLQLRSKNEYIPTQFSFELREPTQFLPDVLDKVRKAASILTVWPETLSAYKRG